MSTPQPTSMMPDTGEPETETLAQTLPEEEQTEDHQEQPEDQLDVGLLAARSEPDASQDELDCGSNPEIASVDAGPMRSSFFGDDDDALGEQEERVSRR